MIFSVFAVFVETNLVGRFDGKEVIGKIVVRRLLKVSRFAICIENRDCEDLEKGKVYRLFPDEAANKEGYVRIIDESTEDYLYPESYFVLLDLPKKAQEALMIGA